MMLTVDANFSNELEEIASSLLSLGLGILNLSDEVDGFLDEPKEPQSIATLGNLETEFLPSEEYKTGSRSFGNFHLSKISCGISKMQHLYGPVKKSARPPIDHYGEHAEVGDDHIAYTSSVPQFLGELYFSHELFGIEISSKDTFVSSYYGNYSESFMLKPQNRGEAWIRADIHGISDLPFLDVAKIRTLIPVSSMNQKHSDTLEGKVSLLAKLNLFTPKSNKRTIDLATCFQYFGLSLNREIRFPYLPTYLGGLGLVPPFDKTRSFCRAASEYKSGEYYELIMNISSAVYKLSRGDKSQLRFLSSLNQVTQRWRTWYSFYSQYVPALSGDLPLETVKYQIGRLGIDSNWDRAVSRLITLDAVCTDDDLLVHWRNMELQRTLQSQLTHNDFIKVLEEERESQQNVTIFSHRFKDDWGEELNYLFDLDHQVMHVDTLMEYTYTGNRELWYSVRKNFIYTKEALFDLYSGHPLRIDLQMAWSGMPLPIFLEPTLSDGDLKHREDLLSWVKKPVGFPPTWLIEDDPILLWRAESFFQEVSNYPGRIPIIYLQSSDYRLGKMINSRTGIPVLHINPLCSEEDINDEIEELRNKGFDILPCILIDTGNISGMKENSILREDVSFPIIRGNITQMFPRRLKLGNQRTKKVIIGRFDISNRFPSNAPKGRAFNKIPFSFKSWNRKKDPD